MGNIFDRFRDLEPDRNAELERMRREALTRPRERSMDVYSCACQGCFHIVKVEAVHVIHYMNQIAPCPECGQHAGWNVILSARWSEGAIEEEAERFFVQFSRWLDTDEGKVAQEKAKWNL